MKVKTRHLNFKEILLWALVLCTLIFLTTQSFAQVEKPGPTNTGYTGTLTPMSVGDIIVDGTVIENASIGAVKIMANNVTIRNCRIDGNWAYYAVRCTYGYIGLLIEDCEITNALSCCVYGSNFTLRRCNIHETNADGVKPVSDCLIENCWFHHFGLADGAHADGVQSRQGGANMTFRYNNFDMPIDIGDNYKSNSNFIMEPDGGQITNTLIEYNWLNGGNWTIYGGDMPGIIVRNNKFGRDYRYGILSGGVVNHECNVWEDTGEAIDPCGPIVENPVITPGGGSFSHPVTVSISCATSGAAIYYTVDGTTPLQTSALYTGPFEVTSSTTVSARAYADGMTESAIVSSSVVILSGTNIALGATVSESANDGNVGANVVDGDVGDASRWSAPGYPQWVQIDLGSSYNVSGINVYTYQSRDYQYIVEASNDGANYSTIVDRSSNSSGAQPIADDVTANARYIKMTVSGAATYTGTWVSINEIMVMGESGDPIDPISVSVSPTSLILDPGQTSDLMATVLPPDATDKSVTYSSDNTLVAMVNATTGLVTAVSEGSAMITVTNNTGGYTATCSVTVNDVTPPTEAYYCDPVSGSMSNNGSQSDPWGSLEDVFNAGKTFVAGDVIYLLDGHHGSPVITGTNTGQINIEALNGHSPTMKSIDFVAASNWKLSGVKISPETAPSYSKENIVDIGENCTNIVIDNCVIQSVQAPWSTAAEWLANYCMGVVISGEYNTISNCQIRNIDFGLLMGGGADNNIISNNLIENFGGDGIQSQGSYNTFEYNTVRNCYEVDDNHDDALQVYTRGEDGTVGGGNSVGVIIRGNTFISKTDPNNALQGYFQGIGGFDGMYTDWLVENNIIVTSHWHGISLFGAVNCTVINNTVIDADNLTPGPLWIMMTAHKDGTPASGNIVRNNLCTDLNNDAGSGIEENNIIISYSEYDIYFTDFVNFDLSLKAGCSAIDAGTATGAPSIDIVGVQRPQINGYDVGAYEFNGAVIPVTGFSMTPDNMILDVEQTGTLTPTILPSDASNQSIIWTSSNPLVAVAIDGVVTALSEGTATITGTTVEGGFSDVCIVTVIAPTGDYNVALYKTVTTTAEDGLNVGGNLVDNITTDVSRWSAETYPQSAIINLGVDCDITSIELYTYQSRAYQFIIEASADGSTYNQIVDRSSNTSTTQPIADAVSTNARYVKLTVTGADGYTGTWVSINEIRVIGSAGTIIIDPTSVTVSPTSLSLLVGESSDLTETISPANATDQTVTWSSGNTSIATVDANGTVTGIAEGQTTITVTTNTGGYTATCSVTVTGTNPITTWDLISYDDFESGFGNFKDGGGDCSLYIEGTYAHEGNNAVQLQDNSGTYSSTYSYTGIDLQSYNQLKIEFWFYPLGMEEGEDFIVEYSDDNGATWQIITNYVSGTDFTNDQFYSVNETGDFSAIIIDDATYNFSSVAKLRFRCNGSQNDDVVYIDEITISASSESTPVIVDPTSVNLDQTSLTLDEAQIAQLTATVLPTDATDKSISWSSSDASVTTVSNGLVTAISAGSATITATTINGLTAICAVTVNEPVIDPTSISLDQTSLTLDETQMAQLTVTVLPTDATDKSISWSSSDASVATASNGLVAAISAGSATITATTINGLTATCAVTVNAPTELWDNITYDDFEYGFGNFKDGGGDCILYTGGTYAHQGNNAGQIQDNQGVYSSFYYTNNVDLSSYSQLKIEFWFYSLGMDDGHDFFVEYSDDDGTTWQSIAQYTQGAGSDFVNGQFYEIAEGGDFASVIIDNNTYNFTSTVKIRFRCDGLQNEDQVYIDEISVTATTASAKQLTKSVAFGSQSQLSVEAYPNPCNGELNLIISGADKTFLLQIIDLTGKVLFVEHLSPAGLHHHLKLETGMLKEGMYILSVAQGGKFNQQKLLIIE